MPVPPVPDNISTSTGPTTTSNDAADNDTDAASDSDTPGGGSGTASDDGSDSDADDIGSDASASDDGGATDNDSDPASDASGSDDDVPSPSSLPATKAGNAALPKLKKVQPAAKSKANPNSKPAKLQIEEVSDEDSDYDSDCDEQPRVVPVSRCCRPGLSWLPCCCW
jgi:hypothetical protein